MKNAPNKGPWVADAPGTGDNESPFHWEVFDGFGRVATVYGEPADSERDARFIAHAPDLYNSLRELVFHAEGKPSELQFELLLASVDRAKELLAKVGV